VFLCGEAQDRLRALETNLIVNCLHVEDQAELQADLARVYQMIAAGAPLSPEERLAPGTPVEITAGPLAGLEGRVLRRGAQLNIVVEVKFLQQGVSAEIESWMVRALESDGRSGSALCVAGR
jgi:transcriptional antiterminator RfaH